MCSVHARTCGDSYNTLAYYIHMFRWRCSRWVTEVIERNRIKKDIIFPVILCPRSLRENLVQT